MNSPSLTRSATFVALLALGAAARADLYATRTGIGQQTGIIRFSDVTGIGFGPDGNLYVDSAANNSVLRYDLTAGTLNIFVSPGADGLVNPADIDFGTDGSLYVADRGANTVRRYRGSDGASFGEFTPAGFGLFGTSGPTFLSFTVIPESSVSGPTAALLGLAVLGLYSGWRGASKDANS